MVVVIIKDFISWAQDKIFYNIRRGLGTFFQKFPDVF